MNVETIKETYTMPAILARYNMTIKKGFCTCPFHKGDHTASMKVYNNGFYCFACGKGGDVIKFVQEYEGLSFRDACKWISGEELDKKARNQIVAADMRRMARIKKRERLNKQLAEVNKQFNGLWGKYLNAQPISDAEPFSDEFATAYNSWQLLVYKQEDLLKQLED